MSTINANDLPFLILADFSDGDAFLILDNGKLKKITRKSLYEDIVPNLRGQKGDTGATGAQGIQGIQGIRGEKGDKGDKGDAGVAGVQGADGLQGEHGWSPLVRLEVLPEGQFLYVYDWVGGQGDKPDAVGYVTRGGLSQTIDYQTSLKGEQGIQGVQGDRGTSGTNGESNYQIARRNGFTGTEAEWLLTQVGRNNYQLAVQDGYTGTLTEWLAEITHKDAYELAVENGFTGSISDWLIDIQGKDAWTPILETESDGTNIYIKLTDWIGGEGVKPPINTYLEDDVTGLPTNFRGLKGDKAWYPLYQIEEVSDDVFIKIVDWVGGEGDKPTETGYLSSTGIVPTIDTAINIRGYEGLSAYDVATASGFVGDQTAWLASLVGAKGDTGLTGDQGDKGYTPLLATEIDSSGIYIKVLSYINGEGTVPTELGYLGSAGLVALKEDATNFKPNVEVVSTTIITNNKVNVITATENTTITSDLTVGQSTEALINPSTFTITFDSITLSDGFSLTAEKDHLVKVFNYDGVIKATILATF